MDGAWDEPTRPRVFVDARQNGNFLRVTWHDEPSQFVISNWEGNVCVGATRVPVAEAPTVIGIFARGLADAATRLDATAPPAQPRTLRQHLHAWWLARGRQAVVLPLRAAHVRRLRRGA